MPKRVVQGLGEINLRVKDLNAMRSFYEEVVGLKLMRQFPKIAIFHIAEGFEGHTQTLGLFDQSEGTGFRGIDSAMTTLAHLAFEISLADYENEKRRLEQKGIKVFLFQAGWVHWRSLFFRDPEGNLVEFVCYDETVVE